MKTGWIKNDEGYLYMDDVNCNKNWRRGYWRVLVVSVSKFPFLSFYLCKIYSSCWLGRADKNNGRYSNGMFLELSKRDIMLKLLLKINVNVSKKGSAFLLRYLLPSLKKNYHHCGWGQILKHSFRMLMSALN